MKSSKGGEVSKIFMMANRKPGSFPIILTTFSFTEKPNTNYGENVD